MKPAQAIIQYNETKKKILSKEVMHEFKHYDVKRRRKLVDGLRDLLIKTQDDLIHYTSLNPDNVLKMVRRESKLVTRLEAKIN